MSKRKSTAGIIVAGVLLGGTLVAGSLVGQAWCARTLEPQAEAALQEAGITDIDVSFQGREAFLSGSEKTQAQLDEAKAIVEAVDGVRWAKITGDIAPEPLPQPEVRVATNSTGVVLSGTVSTQAEADVLAAEIEKVFGGPVTNQMTVDPKVESAGWVSELTDALETSPPVAGGSLNAGTEEITVTGTVTSETDLATLEQAFDKISVPATTDVTVSAPEPEPEPEPEPQPELTQDEINTVNSASVRFGQGQYTLTDSTKRQIDSIIPLLKKSTSALTVKGYVSVPHSEGNEIRDSKKRAQALADYLISQGIDSSRITVEGRGTADPIASNNTEAGRLANQRATITLA
ncbi:MAG: OmpA family protein [Propionibacteriaceae bacterium]|jgi:outer membrane protein OmpA-like peptidoglycan-associated protein|nr:OmpA family protein [Propionibacteriaceae bacterium]